MGWTPDPNATRCRNISIGILQLRGGVVPARFAGIDHHDQMMICNDLTTALPSQSLLLHRQHHATSMRHGNDISTSSGTSSPFAAHVDAIRLRDDRNLG